jgi:hypothetical protein
VTGYNVDRENRGVTQPLRMAAWLTRGAVIGGLGTVLVLIVACAEAGDGDWPASLSAAAGLAFMTLVLAALAVLLRWCAARYEQAAEAQRAPRP